VLLLRAAGKWASLAALQAATGTVLLLLLLLLLVVVVVVVVATACKSPGTAAQAGKATPPSAPTGSVGLLLLTAHIRQALLSLQTWQQ
jgi:hypothetical protein